MPLDVKCTKQRAFPLGLHFGRGIGFSPSSAAATTRCKTSSRARLRVLQCGTGRRVCYQVQLLSRLAARTCEMPWIIFEERFGFRTLSAPCNQFGFLSACSHAKCFTQQRPMHLLTRITSQTEWHHMEWACQCHQIPALLGRQRAGFLQKKSAC